MHSDDGQHFLAHLPQTSFLFSGAPLEQHWEKSCHAPFHVHCLPLTKYFPQQFQDVFDQLGGSVGEQFENYLSVASEEFRDVVGVKFADGSQHRDTLEAHLPAFAIYVVVKLV